MNEIALFVIADLIGCGALVLLLSVLTPTKLGSH